MPIPPDTRAPGDSGHVADHNNISDALTALAAAATTETTRATAAEALLAPKASPALTGTPTAPTASALTSTTQVATTAYADSAVAAEASRATAAEALKAPLASPALTGTPTAPTRTALTSNTGIATTAYADSAVAVETSRATTAEALALPLTGGTMSGAIAMGSHKVTGLTNGSGAQDAAAYGQTLAGGAGAPMTTLGDIVYENATPAPARLPGNTTATKNYLQQTGTGSVSAVPAWGTIAAGDVPTLNQNTTGTAAGLSSTLAIASGGTGSTSRNFGGLLTPTAVKTGAYTAAAGDFVPVDTTSGGVTVTLPNAPADLTVVAVKHVIQGTGNTVTIACAGSDVFNKTSGATSGTLTLLAQGMCLQYKASGAIWYIVADDLALAQLDSRYSRVFSPLAYGAKGDGTTDDTTAVQAAFTAAAAVRGTVELGSLVFKTTSAIAMPYGVSLHGATNQGGGGTYGAIINTTSDLFTVTGTISSVNISNVYLAATAGHVFNCAASSGVAGWTIRNSTLQQNGTGFSIFSMLTSASYIGNYVGENCNLVMAAGATVPAWNMVAAGGAINDNVWADLIIRSTHSTTVPFFSIQSTTGLNTDNIFRNVIAEQLDAGIIKMQSCVYTTIENVAAWDTTTFTGNLFSFGNGGVYNSGYILIRNSGRRGGTMTGGTYDVASISGTTTSIVIENCGGEFDTGVYSLPAAQTTYIGTGPAGAGSFQAPVVSAGGYLANAAPVALTDAATIAVDASKGKLFRVTLGGNRTLGNPTNPVDGQPVIFEVIQDGTGSRTLAYDTAYTFSIGLPAPTLTTTAALRDFIGFVYNSTAAKWYCVGFLNGF